MKENTKKGVTRREFLGLSARIGKFGLSRPAGL